MLNCCEILLKWSYISSLSALTICCSYDSYVSEVWLWPTVSFDSWFYLFFWRLLYTRDDESPNLPGQMSSSKWTSLPQSLMKWALTQDTQGKFEALGPLGRRSCFGPFTRQASCLNRSHIELSWVTSKKRWKPSALGVQLISWTTLAVLTVRISNLAISNLFEF